MLHPTVGASGSGLGGEMENKSEASAGASEPSAASIADPARWLALPALGAGLAALLAPLLRAPIPLDETRYLQIFHELRSGSWWSLTLNQEPYTEKTPLLFWIGELLHRLGLSPELALRLIPALSAAGTVLVLGRLARRTRAPLAPWLLCTALLSVLLTQVLLFDALLTLGVWGALAAWSEGRDRGACLWSALAVFAKGPVALLFLLPLGWALAVLRPPQRRPEAQAASRHGTRARPWRRGLLLAALACLPLAAWALACALLDPQSGEALLWDRWGGRIGKHASHARPVWFYLPFLLGGTLPFVPVWLRGGLPARGTAARRVALATCACFLCLSLIAGKQPHYLLPLVPALALWSGWRLEERAGSARRALALGAWLQLALLFVAVVAMAGFGWGYLHERYGELAEALHDDAGTWLAFGLAGGGLLAAALVWRGRGSLRSRLLVLCLATIGALVPIQYAAGRLLLPPRLGPVLAALSERPLATYRNFEAGFFNYTAGRLRVETLPDAQAVASWWEEHPEGLVVADEEDLEELDGVTFHVALIDRLRGNQQVLLARRPLTIERPGPDSDPGAGPGRGDGAPPR